MAHGTCWVRHKIRRVLHAWIVFGSPLMDWGSHPTTSGGDGLALRGTDMSFRSLEVRTILRCIRKS